MVLADLDLEAPGLPSIPGLGAEVDAAAADAPQAPSGLPVGRGVVHVADHYARSGEVPDLRDHA